MFSLRNWPGGSRLFLELLLAIALVEWLLMMALGGLAHRLSPALLNTLDALGLVLMVTPFVFWRGSVWLGRENQALSQAMQYSDTGVLLLDRDLRIRWANQGFCRMSGYQADDIVGYMPGELLSSGSSDPQQLARLQEAAKGQQPGKAVLRNRRKDGALYWAEVELRPEFDARGRLRGYIELCSDITSLIEAQRALGDSLRDAQALWHAFETHTIVSVADQSGRIQDANAAFCSISGYTRAELLGQDHRILASGLHAPAFWAALWSDIRQGRPWRGELRNRRRDGSHYWVDCVIAPFMGADGMVEKFVSVSMDISDRKQALHNLAFQSRLLQEVGEALPYGVAVYDERHKLRLHNARFRELLNVPPGMLTGSDFYFKDLVRLKYARGDFGFDIRLEALQQRMEATLLERSVTQEERSQADGSHLEFRSCPISAGWTVVNYLDITERKRQQQSLRESQDRITLATQSAGIGIWTFHPHTREMGWDAQQYRIFGMDPDAITEKPHERLWTRCLHPEDRDRVQAAFRDALDHATRFAELYRIIRPDGTVRYVKGLGIPRGSNNGPMEYMVGVNQDVTEQTEQAMSLQLARDEAQEASRIKSQFLANISHEIRTPMNAVLGLLHLLHGTAPDLRQSNYIARAEGAARQLIEQINAILDYSKIEAQRMTLDCERFALEALLQDLATVAATSVGTKRLQVLLDVDPTLPRSLVGDRLRLQQVLLNLVGNAVRFTPAGHVLCRVMRQRQADGSEQIVFSVEDSGIGIAPDQLDNIFNSFTQVQNSHTREHGGVGLGLTISQRLVQLMGGQIAVRSVPGEGSCFCFAIALQAGDPATDDAVALAPPQEYRSALVLDELPLAQEVSARMLEALGLQVAAGKDAQGLEHALQRRLQDGKAPFDLVLLDWTASDSEGRALLAQVRQRYAAQGWLQPLVLVSTRSATLPAMDDAGLAGRIDGFLSKPFTAGMLADALRQVHARRRQGASPAGSLRQARLEGLRILVVEDMELNRNIVQEMLQREGAQVSLAENGLLGVQAVQAAQSQVPFDLVLMDIQMPVMDGYAASRKIREELQLHALPIVALTSNTHALDRKCCLDAGMNRHVGKPFELDHLVHVLREVTGRDSLGREPAPAPTQDPAPSSDAAAQAQPALAPLALRWDCSRGVMPEPELLRNGALVLLPLDAPPPAPGDGAADAPSAILVTDRLDRAVKAREAQGAGATMPPMLTIVLADAPTEEEMQAGLRSGVQDMVPLSFALRYLPELVRSKLDAAGALLPLPQQFEQVLQVAPAMARMQSTHAFFCELLRSFLEEIPERRSNLEQAWAQGAEPVMHQSHSLKGLARTFGLVRLGQLAAQAEGYASRCHTAHQALADQNLWLCLDGEMQSARYQILRWLDRYEHEASTPKAAA